MDRPTGTAERLRNALEALAETLEGFSFWLPGPDLRRRERARAELVRTIREYLIPRMVDPDAPVVAVIVGPSGGGKSVLLNTLAGKRASAPGALRPTTRAPVVYAHRRNQARYRDDFLAGVRGREGGDFVVVPGDDELVGSLTLVDAPDFESVFSDSRIIGDEVLAVADLCVFVASALRYADAAAWSFLEQIRARGVPVLFVMNRLPADPATANDLMADFAAMLARRGLLLRADPSLIFGVPEQEVSMIDGSLATGTLESIRSELALIADPALRRQVVRQSTEGAVAEVIERTDEVAASIDTDRSTIDMLRKAAAGAYAEELAAAGDLVRSGKLVTAVTARHWEQLLGEVAAAIARRAGRAARNAAAAWDADPTGHVLLGRDETLWRHGSDTPADARHAVEDWALELVNLMTLRGALERRRPAARRRLAFSMVRAVLEPGGERGGELGRYLDARVSDELVEHGMAGLEQRVRNVLERDADRFREALTAFEIAGGLADRIRDESATLSEIAGVFYGE